MAANSPPVVVSDWVVDYEVHYLRRRRFGFLLDAPHGSRPLGLVFSGWIYLDA